MLALNRIGQGAVAACLLSVNSATAASCKSTPLAVLKMSSGRWRQTNPFRSIVGVSTNNKRSTTITTNVVNKENLNNSKVFKRCLSSSPATPVAAAKLKCSHPIEHNQQQNHNNIKVINGGNDGGANKAGTPTASIGTNAVYSDYETLQVSSPIGRVLHIQLNRPAKRNALNRQTLQELQSVFRTIHEDKRCRAVVISGNGKDFSAGLDHLDIEKILHEITSNQGITVNSDVARRAKFLRNLLSKYQETFNMVERCAKPVIVSVHGACLGAALNLICCADIRFCTQDSFFQLKDVSAGMMADMGVLQRMPKMVANDSWIRELALSARRASSNEAKENGLVSRVYEDQQQALNGALEMAANITKNSPVAVQGTKLCMNYSRDHSVHDGLIWALNWNMGMLQSDDLLKAMESVGRNHDMPEFDDL